MKKILILILVLILLSIYPIYKVLKKPQATPTSTPTRNTASVSNPAPPIQLYDFPINQFKERITKKPFGIYVTPQKSPVQPERFTGYHTGTDIEYQDVTQDIPVFAINDGTIKLAETASGYGGVMILETEISGNLHSVLYGHIRPSSLPKVGQKVTKGEQIGLLGTGYSTETDGERRHLHFAVLSDNRLDIKGYVQTKNELSGWIDPTTLYQ